MLTAIRELIRLEPVRVRAVIGGLVGFAIALGIDVTPEQQGTLIAFVDMVLPLLASVIGAASARGQVYTQASVDAIQSEAVARDA